MVALLELVVVAMLVVAWGERKEYYRVD